MNCIGPAGAVALAESRTATRIQKISKVRTMSARWAAMLCSKRDIGGTSAQEGPGQDAQLAQGEEEQDEGGGEEVEGADGADHGARARLEVALQGRAAHRALAALVDGDQGDRHAVAGAPQDEVQRLPVPEAAGDEGDGHGRGGEEDGTRPEQGHLAQPADDGPVDV